MGRVIADLDDRDRQARAGLHLALRARRRALGWSQRKVGDVAGYDAATVRRLERLGVDQSYATTVMWWARALGLRLALEPVGFPPQAGPPPGAFSAVRARMSPAAADTWHIAALTGDLAGIRMVCKVTQEQIGQLLGITPQAVSMIETGGRAGTLVALQRHARAIAHCARLPDAYLAVRLEDTRTVA